MTPDKLDKITIGLGWKSRADLDAAVILVDEDGKCVDMIYFDKL